RQQREEDSEIRDQADKPADRSQEIKIWNAQQPEDNATDDAVQHAHQDVPDNKTADHGRNSSHGAKGSQAMFFWEQLYGGRVRVILPRQHEVNKKWDETHRQQDFSEHATSGGDYTRETRRLLHFDWNRLRASGGRSDDGTCSL